MENLTKQQLILLALLVSFVTSMATGIVTVSLMDQAPQGVTQTINRVIERTVEKVVPATNNAAAVVTKETVVVKADDLVVEAVAKNKQKLVRIIKVRELGESKKEIFGGLAVPISKNGIFMTDISVLVKTSDSFGSIVPETYKAITAKGKVFQVIPIGVDEKNNLVFFGLPKTVSLSDLGDFSPVVLGDSDGLKLGQTIIAIGGEDSNTISTGIVSSLKEIPKDSNAKTSSKTDLYTLINTDIRGGEVISGTIILNLSGEMMGMKAGKEGEKGSFLPSKMISAAVSKINSSNNSSGETSL